MARPKTSIYAAGITCLGFICFILAAAAVGIPIWGHYDSPSGGYYDSDRGYFSLFKVCKQLTYNREKCGSDVSKFQLAYSVYISGLLAVLSTVTLGVYCILSVIQMAMISSREKVVMKYTSLVMFKVFMALIGCLLAIIATVLFAVQIDQTENYGFRVTRGISFYIQIAVIGLTIALFVASVYDMMFSRKPDGDPTMAIDTSPANATTFNNPGFKEGRTRNGVSVTDASGKPYSGIRNGGSVASMNTTLTSVSNGSTVESVTRSPLRSSLKKPRPKDALGIQNPGFSGSGHSPPMNRNGSVKKVRIQTHSTEV